ncbi:hypothetical protein AAVH_16414 [Aphelenchoides avenae]|nr:hypothetical protein AAVH_16414 [Aphelenchus avenae]
MGDRERFLAEYANLPGFGYLKRIALKADRKKTIQRKKTSMQGPPELRKRVQELSKYNVNPADQSGSILRENEPLADFLYQGDLVLPAPLAEAVNMTKSLKQHRAGGFNDVVNGVKIEFQKWPHDSPICFRFKEGSELR